MQTVVFCKQVLILLSNHSTFSLFSLNSALWSQHVDLFGPKKLLEGGRNIFLKKLCTKCGRESSPRFFPKNQNCAYLWINRLKLCTVCFYCIFKSRTTKIYPILEGDYFLLPRIKLFQKTKKRSWTSLPDSFS